MNQVLPEWLSRRLLYFFIPKSKGINGFPAYYNNCYYRAIKKLLERNGFRIVDLRPSYYQSAYFDFFAPLFLVNALYEFLVQS